MADVDPSTELSSLSNNASNHSPSDSSDDSSNDSPQASPSSATLWEKVKAQTEHALACGALQSIPTHADFIEQNGVSFLVRSLDNLARKEKATQQQKQASLPGQHSSGQQVNPFLPYEEDLFVTHLSDTHLCLLNKYNVVEHHLLIVTRAFEEQETWLNLQDFSALSRCIIAIDGLAFYNGGQIAGASQPHKHLQLVPMPLSPQGHPIPIDAVVADALPNSSSQNHPTGDAISVHPISVYQVDSLPFAHAIAPLTIQPEDAPDDVGSMLLDMYRRLLQEWGVDAIVEGDRQTLPYNLLITRQWMMVVPRHRERYASISVNSLGFAGSLFVKDEEQMEILRQAGPVTVLQHVACPKT